MRNLRHGAMYAAIGSFVFVLDAGSFVLLMRAHVTLACAATLAYILGVCAHFTLNRTLNFRNFQRSLHGQIGTYLVVVGFCYCISLGVIEAGFRLLHLTPFIAKVVSVAVNIPIGYVGHRYLTFSGGIRAAFGRLHSQYLEKRIA
jgi:putative flippase GtrA